MSEAREAWLCFIQQETGVFTAKALYDNEMQAEAWAAGVKAAYAQPTVLWLDSNEGEFDLREKLRAAEEATND